MADRTGIEWTDATWNPVTGCTEVSPGCDHCYAKTFAERWRGIPGHHFEHGFDVQLRPDKLSLPLTWRRPRRVFVNSMSDLFHVDVPDDYIARVFAVMACTPEHTYQILTKRHGRMRSLLSRGQLGTEGFSDMVEEAMAEFTHAALEHWPLPNVWLGVSVEDQRWAQVRIPALLATPAALRFLSCEPLLGPVDLGRWFKRVQRACDRCHLSGPMDFHNPHLWGNCRCACHPTPPARPDWVIVGGESGPLARPMHPAWVRQVRDLCVGAGVPVFFKQWGQWRPQPRYSTDSRHHVVLLDGRDHGTPWPGWTLDHPHAVVMERVSKHTAGRELDGATHEEFPEVTR